MRAESLRILVADDHPAVREGLEAVINRERDMRVVGVASNGREAFASFQSLYPDVTLLDVRMPGLDGIQALTAIRRLDPDAPVVMLSGFDAEEDVYRALAAGARGYVTKESGFEELATCIRAVARGNRWVPPGVASKFASRLRRHELSPREAAVLRLVAEGNSNKEIAETLRITEGTVKVHVDHILKKLNVRSRTAAVALAFRLGLVRVEE